MSISLPERNRKRALRTVLTYLGAALFCGIFSLVYEHFSHGVYSGFMVFLFLFPLAGGALPFGAIRLMGARCFPGRLALNLYHSGIAALTVGSCLQGVLEIYGTTSPYMPVYWIAGGALAGSGMVCFLLTASGRRH